MNARCNHEQAYVGRISTMHGIPGDIVFIITFLCGGVGMMLNKKDILLMLATSIAIVIATECVIYAITGYGFLGR